MCFIYKTPCNHNAEKNVNYTLGGHIAINDISVNFTLTALDI